MKKLIVFIVLSLVGISNLSANDCYGKALNDYSSDSVAYQFFNEDVYGDFEQKGEKAAVDSIRLLEEKLNCHKNAFEVKKVSCREIMPGNALSKACYVESNLGYFFISVDMMDKVNLVFNRWD